MTEAIRGSPVARRVGRYALCAELAAGGMATVHIGRLLGPVGFARTVAIKRLHPQFAKDPEFVSMFLDEARLAARIRHPNVVSVLDVVATKGELFLVMDFVLGESMSRLARAADRAGKHIPLRVLTAIVCGALQGLHAAHETADERGAPLGIVHRDISPQNILLGTDGVPRLIDFGVAKASGRDSATRDGELKGKLSYMAPEQVRGAATRQSDVFSMGVVLWEAMTRRRLFAGETDVQTFSNVLQAPIEAPSRHMSDQPLPSSVAHRLDEVVLQALSRDVSKRFATARDFAVALERAVGIATPLEVGEWMNAVAGDALRLRTEQVREIESSSSGFSVHPESGSQEIGASSVGITIKDDDAPPSSAPDVLTLPPPRPLGAVVELFDDDRDSIQTVAQAHPLSSQLSRRGPEIEPQRTTELFQSDFAPMLRARATPQAPWSPPRGADPHPSASLPVTTIGPPPTASGPLAPEATAQVTRVAMATNSLSQPGPSFRFVAILAASFVLAMVGGVVFASRVVGADGAPAASSRAPAASAPPVATTIASAPLKAPAVTPMSVDDLPRVSPPSASTAQPPSQPTSKPAAATPSRPSGSKPHGKASTSPSSKASAASAKPDCNPPFTVDADGHKHFKVECL